MGLPGRYRKRRERTISTFDFFDIAQNRALETFFLSNTSQGGVDKFILTNVATDAQKSHIVKAVTSSALTIYHNNDHELLMDAPMIIEGDAILNIPLRIKDVTDDCQAFISAGLFISGATLNQIGGEISGAILKETAGGTSNEVISVMRLGIPRTQIKRGEYLRLNIKTSAVSLDGEVMYGHSPLGNDAQSADEDNWGDVRAYVTTKGTLLLPIKIDL